MTPTAKFRWLELWVERDITFDRHPSAMFFCSSREKVRVLQQWWEDDNYEINGVPKHSGEWRDIPVEEA